MQWSMRRTLRYHYLRFRRLKGDPSSIARGVAMGLFIGVTPTIPLHTILLIVLSGPLRANLVAAILAAAVVSNPLTFFLQYYFSWKVGQAITQNTLGWEQIEAVMQVLSSHAGFRQSLTALCQLGGDALVTLNLGGFVLATPIAVTGYVASLRFFSSLRRKRLEKHVLN